MWSSFCVSESAYAAVTVSLSVHVCEREAKINTGVKDVTVTVNVMQTDCCQS